MSERAAEHNYRMALMFYRTERYEDAIAILDDLALEYPDSKHVVYALAKCFMKVGRYSDARALCEELITRLNDDRAEVLLLRMGDMEDTYTPPSQTREAPPELPATAETPDITTPPRVISGESPPPDDTTSSWMSSTPTGLFTDKDSPRQTSSGAHFSSPPTEKSPPFSTPPPLNQEHIEQPLIVPPPLFAEGEKEDPSASKPTAASRCRKVLIATVVVAAAAVTLWLMFSPHHFVFPEDRSLGMLQIREDDGRRVTWTDYVEARGEVMLPRRAYIKLTASEDLSESDLMLLIEASWLKCIDLSESQVTDDMVDLLVQLRQLELIDVRGTGLSEAAITHLRQGLPGCVVRFDL